MRKGFAIVELVVAMIVLAILALGSFNLIRNITQRAKVVSAKAQIAQMAKLLEDIKVDTSFYPVFLQDVASETPPLLQEKGWQGSYTANIPLDPWGTPYFYKIPPTTLFSSPPMPRMPGKPDTYTQAFEANPGEAILRIENWGVTSCSVYVNGIEIIEEQEFKKNPKPQIIEKKIYLDGENNLITWARSKPEEFLVVSVSSDRVPTKKYFVVGSYGRDRQEGGLKFCTDISWKSDVYPNFQ